jgi:hypothetical protein
MENRGVHLANAFFFEFQAEKHHQPEAVIV